MPDKPRGELSNDDLIAYRDAAMFSPEEIKESADAAVEEKKDLIKVQRGEITGHLLSESSELSKKIKRHFNEKIRHSEKYFLNVFFPNLDEETKELYKMKLGEFEKIADAMTGEDGFAIDENREIVPTIGSIMAINEYLEKIPETPQREVISATREIYNQIKGEISKNTERPLLLKEEVETSNTEAMSKFVSQNIKIDNTINNSHGIKVAGRKNLERILSGTIEGQQEWIIEACGLRGVLTAKEYGMSSEELETEFSRNFKNPNNIKNQKVYAVGRWLDKVNKTRAEKNQNLVDKKKALENFYIYSQEAMAA